MLSVGSLTGPPGTCTPVRAVCHGEMYSSCRRLPTAWHALEGRKPADHRTVRARARGSPARSSSDRGLQHRQGSLEGEVAPRGPDRGSHGSLHSYDEEGEDRPGGGLLGGLAAAADGLPARTKLIAATSASFMICNMDKVNISIAILPMAREFGWSPTVSGLVQSSFFYGYLISQLPGGWLAARLGGRRVLPIAVALFSAATAGVPFLAGTLLGLCAARAAVGLGEAVAPSCATEMIARAVPVAGRSRATAAVFSGLHVGALVGLLAAPPLIAAGGWRAVFYVFGGAGLVWCLGWEALLARLQRQDPAMVALLDGSRGPRPVRRTGAGARISPPASAPAPAPATPWRAFLSNRPLQALAFAHFCNNWFHYVMLAWLPTYFTDRLALDLDGAARFALLPPLAAIAVSFAAGSGADFLVERGVAVATVRKSAQGLAFLGPALCLLWGSQATDDAGIVASMTLALGLASFSLGGLYSNHADLSPRYAPILLGMTNVAGAVPGIVGIAGTGFLYDMTGSWDVALFAPSIFLFLAGTLVYVRWGSSDEQDFSAALDAGPARPPSKDD
ncbi:PHT4I [Auxenochlorella protothecoides x Auxenochlorella symbiontica]|uniref:Major facilitator superfamily (MFS) profile domain-containing protein n=1 Tax=Auxenochlorella protothecoides TaxID=3075 RepID=A0A1D1ZVQ4_AUXPR